MVCPRCETANHPVDECPERHEEYHGLPSDHFDADDDGVRCWVQAIDETWHASMYFEDSRHVAACGECFETPVADVRDDPRRLADAHTCDDCEAYLEADEDETVPDGGEFEPASELRADGGEVQSSGVTPQSDHGELKRRLAHHIGSDPSRYAADIGTERHKRLLDKEITLICDRLGLEFLADESKQQRMDAIMLKLGRDHRTGAQAWDTSDLVAVVRTLQSGGDQQ